VLWLVSRTSLGREFHNFRLSTANAQRLSSCLCGDYVRTKYTCGLSVCRLALSNNNKLMRFSSSALVQTLPWAPCDGLTYCKHDSLGLSAISQYLTGVTRLQIACYMNLYSPQRQTDTQNNKMAKQTRGKIKYTQYRTFTTSTQVVH